MHEINSPWLEFSSKYTLIVVHTWLIHVGFYQDFKFWGSFCGMEQEELSFFENPPFPNLCSEFV